MNQRCPQCEGQDISLVTNSLRFGRTANICRCNGCSLVYLDQNSFSFPANFYETEYHQTYLTHVDPDMLDPQKHFDKMQSASKLWIDRVRGMLTGNESVLDVGCSTGHLLAGIRNNAKAIYGHELSVKEVAFCENVLGLDVADKPLSERFEPGSFDLITLIFVLEHIGDPVPFLVDLRRFLKPGGRLVIVVPNVQDPLLSFYKIPQFADFYYCIEHVYYYSPVTLANLLEKAGFKGLPEAVQEYPITNHLNWAYRQKPSETLAARRLVPDVDVADPGLMPEWEKYWTEMDRHYRDFMTRSGFSDRIWCVAEVRP